VEFILATIKFFHTSAITVTILGVQQVLVAVQNVTALILKKSMFRFRLRFTN